MGETNQRSNGSHRSDPIDDRAASAPAPDSVATRRVLRWAQAVGRLRLSPGALWRSLRPSRPDERSAVAPSAERQPRVGATPRMPLNPTPLDSTLRRHLARLRHMAHVARMASVARAGTSGGRFARWSVPSGRRGATWWRLGEVRRWRERRMRRLYTLRELFRQGIRGQADLHEAIQQGDPLTRRSPPSPRSGSRSTTTGSSTSLACSPIVSSLRSFPSSSWFSPSRLSSWETSLPVPRLSPPITSCGRCRRGSAP